MQVKKIVSGVSAAMLLMCYASAFGAGLGKIWVNSKLGQPLSADVELIVPDSAELKSLHAHMGSADAFNQANLEMTSALESVHFSILSKPDGSMFVHLSSVKPITDPFLDMIIELDWRNGQLLREYTLLLDPVDMPSAPNLTVAPAVVSAAPVAAPAISPSMPVATVNMPPAATSRPAPRQRPTPSASTPATPPVQNVGTETLKTVKVRRGVTLSSIAIQHQPVGVHLDQMLVGLYRENTQAFDGNMNRMKVGQVLRIPTKGTLTAISEVTAAREIHLQAEDWHNYRQKLAGQVEHATVKKSGANEISGNVIAAVQQKTPAPVAGTDVLKLSHAGTSKVMPSGTANSQSALAEQKRMNQDDVAASKKALEEEKIRTAMLEKSVEEIRQLLALKNQQLAAMQKLATAGAPVQPLPVEPQIKSQNQMAKHLTPKVADKQGMMPVQRHALKPLPAPVPSATAKWYTAIDLRMLLEAGGALALLALLGFAVRGRQHRLRSVDVEGGGFGGSANPKTQFDTQRGESVNTKSNTFSTNFSQAGLGILDTHNVDPVAEAEVYMAYGRDGQAEEILKEAMVKDPERHEIKVKLLEIYARRHAVPDFEVLATDLYSKLSEAPSPQWAEVAEMGRRIDPHNPMYFDENHHDVAPAGGAAEPVVVTPVASDETQQLQVDDLAKIDAPLPVSMQAKHDVDLDSDLAQELDFSDTLAFDFNLDEIKGDTEADVQAKADKPAKDHLDEVLDQDEYLMKWETVSTGNEQQADSGAQDFSGAVLPHDSDEMLIEELIEEMEMSADDSLDGDLEFEMDEVNDRQEAGTSGANPAPVQPPMLDFSGIDLNFESESPTPAESPAPDVEAENESLSSVAVADLSEEEQEIQTKLALVQVYQEMGDLDNAREILHEVIAEGNPEQRGVAQVMLQKMDAEHG